MLPEPIPAIDRHEPGSKRGLLRRKIEWLFSPELFHLKLLLGTAVGVFVILIVAVTCVIVTMQNQTREKLRARTIDVMRLSSVVENDIAELENAYRGHLLNRNGSYLEDSSRQQKLFFEHTEELTEMMASNSVQRKRLLKMRDNVQSWLKASSLIMFQLNAPGANRPSPNSLSAAPLVEAREALQTVQREEEIFLNQSVREQEWAIQSTQVLNFIPKMEQAAAEMQKEKRGYLLTGDPAYIDSYKRATGDFYTYHGYLSVLVASQPEDVVQLTRIRETLETWITQCAVPFIEAKSRGEKLTNAGLAARSETLMDELRSAVSQFEKEQMDIYHRRSDAAARERILTATAIDLLCALAAGLMIVSSSYSFVLCRRQLRNLEGADHRIRAVMENILDGMITLDGKGAITAMNPAAMRMFGYKKSEIIGEDLTKLVRQHLRPEAHQAAVDCDWGQLVQRTGGTFFAVARNRGKTDFPIEISLSEVKVEKQTFFIAMIRDITAQKRFEQELAAEKKSLAVTLASIGDGVITIDLSGRIMICNAAGEAMTGYSASEVVGQPLKLIFQITADPSRRQMRANQPAGFRNEAETILYTTPERATLTSRDGIERLTEQVASPIRDSKNELCGVVLVFRDITERQRDEAERRKAETLEQLGLLAGGIAHDFNNLLTAIIGNISLAQLLLPPTDEMVDRLDDAKNASLRARDLAQQLLTFARGGAPIKKAASISCLIEETVSFSLRGSHSRSQLDLAPDLWSAEFDPGQISQVIANIVVNAEQAMPDGGTLHVSCENFTHTAENSAAMVDLAPGDYIRIRLRDEGVGIPEQYLKQIFDPYFTTKPKGNGLGLATTYSIVKNHSGLITVESELHCGATFTIYLPALRKQAVQMEEPVLSDEPINGSGRVLIVDDEEAIRALVEFTLDRLGYQVSGAETALQGIELYRQAMVEGHRFDLVILDLTLPGGMGGKDALKKLIEIDPTVNAVVSSGYAMDATMSRYEDFGFRGVIAKPYEAAELGRKVRDVIAAGKMDYEHPALELQNA